VYIIKNSRILSLILGLPLLVLVGCVATETIQDTSIKSEAAQAGVIWLIENNQNDDGGYGTDFETGQPASNIPSTIDAIQAIASTGQAPDKPYADRKNTPVSYLRENVSSLTAYVEGSGGNAGKAILALVEANQDPREFAGTDWVKMLIEQATPSGPYNTADAFNQSLAIRALAAVNEPIPDDAVQWLKDQQAEDGSWDDGFGTLQNPDATAISIMALSAAGVSADDAALAKALQFLAGSQLPSGGWEYGPGFGENANSTALVIQALASAGENYNADDGDWSQDGNTPLRALLTYQSSTGAFQADFGQGPVDNFLATVQAIPAVIAQP
jgi:hypothetical protein